MQIAVLIGLRCGEVETLTIAHLKLDFDVPLIRIEAKDTKSWETAEILLSVGFVDDFRE
jgi:hypothetical protein